MVILEFTLLLLACVLISAVIDQFVPKVSSPLIQIALGVIVYFLAGGKYDFSIDNNLFMVLFVAPLLYNEARHANKETLVKNKGSILSLAIGLVVLITLVVGFSLNALVPSIPLAAAFALGAALGPTDAIAVTSLPDEVRLGPRREGILQGECLINDASGIVAFQFSIAAVTTGAFSAIDAGTNFAFLFIGGIIIGLILGFLTNLIIKWSQSLGLDNTTFHVLFELFLPFIVYFAAESFHVSGILAVVAAGLVSSGLFSRKKTKNLNPNISKLSIVSSSVWEVFIFALNGIVFVMLGAILPEAMQQTWNNPNINNYEMLIFVLLIVIVIFVSRFIWILIIEYRYNKSNNLALFSKDNVHSALIMTVGGPKGAVTMAIVFTIPAVLSNGAEFPGRAIIMFIAGGVIVFTLVLANFILPILMPNAEKKKQMRIEGMKEDLAVVTIDILRKVIENLNSKVTDENRAAVQNVIDSYSNRIAQIKKTYNFDDELNIQYREKAYEWEREFVVEQFRKQNVRPKIARIYLRQLGNKEDLLVHHTSLTWKIRNEAIRSKNFIKLLPKRTKNIAKGSYAEPGETARFTTQDLESLDKPISTLNELKQACYNHVIKKLDDEIQTSDVPNEDITNVLSDYRMQLQTLKEKSPSLTTIRSINEETENFAKYGLMLELEFVKEKFENHEITRAQYRKYYDKVVLMQLALEGF